MQHRCQKERQESVQRGSGEAGLAGGVGNMEKVSGTEDWIIRWVQSKRRPLNGSWR